MSSITSVSPRTLGDVIPGGLVRSIALVVGGAVFVGLTAQVVIPLLFTPVPLTLQTFSVLLVGAALGSRRGLASMALYLLVGHGRRAVVRRGQQRLGSWPPSATSSASSPPPGWSACWPSAAPTASRLRAAGLMVLGNLVIYVFGVAGLLLMTPFDLPTAIAKGVLPFLLGDAIKIVAAAALLPVTWKLVNARRDS